MRLVASTPNSKPVPEAGLMKKGRRIMSGLLPVFVAPFRRWRRPPFSVRRELVRCVPCTNR